MTRYHDFCELPTLGFCVAVKSVKIGVLSSQCKMNITGSNVDQQQAERPKAGISYQECDQAGVMYVPVTELRIPSLIIIPQAEHAAIT